MVLSLLILSACQPLPASMPGTARAKIDSADSGEDYATARRATRAPRYLGTTGDSFDGGDGLGAISNACDAAWPGSRICTDDEITLSRPYPAPGVEAWVLGQGLQYDGGVWSTRFGMQYGSMNCASSYAGLFRSSTASSGVIVDADGDVYGSQSCATARVVACCG